VQCYDMSICSRCRGQTVSRHSRVLRWTKLCPEKSIHSCGGGWQHECVFSLWCEASGCYFMWSALRCVVVRYKSSWPPPKRSISEFSCTYNADRMPTKTGRLWHVRNRIEASGCAVFGMGQSGASTNGRTATARRLVAVDCDCFSGYTRARSGR